MRGDNLMKTGAVIMAMGMMCTLVAIIPLFASSVTLTSYWWGLSMLTGVGLAMVIIGLRRSSRVRTKLK